MKRVRRAIRQSGDGIDVVADVHAVIATNGEAVSSQERWRHMAEKDVRDERAEELTDEELEQQAGEELPDREAMSLINTNLAAPINAAVALNVLSDNSTAYANAEQSAEIIQST